MNILIACEESQTVCKAFRAKGHKAFSCDILPCSGGYPEWHIQGDCLPVIKSQQWDMIIAHPPCTYLSRAGSYYLYHPDDKNLPIIQRRPHPDHPERRKKQQEAMDFVLDIWFSECPRIVIENPVGALSNALRPDQIIHPYQFGHPYTKATCLWIKGLPLLKPTKIVPPLPSVKIGNHGKTYGAWWAETMQLPLAQRAKVRSKTFDGIAEAMASQWG